jgi:hypothetical protein
MRSGLLACRRRRVNERLADCLNVSMIARMKRARCSAGWMKRIGDFI